MDIQKLLIADHSPLLVDELTQRLNGTFLIRSCSDGITARQLLTSFRPDVVVLDLMLTGNDGISLVQSIITQPHRPAILLTTTLITPFVEYLAINAKVDYILTKPCDIEVLITRVCEIAGHPCGAIFMPEQQDMTVCNMLLALNVSLNHKGYAYLCYGIDWYRTHPGESVTGGLYPAISKKFKVSRSAVEHDIRRAIDAAWRSGDLNVWKLYFYAERVSRPTNTIFISTLAHRYQACIDHNATVRQAR